MLDIYNARWRRGGFTRAELLPECLGYPRAASNRGSVHGVTHHGV